MRNSRFSGLIADLFSRIGANRRYKQVNFSMCGVFVSEQLDYPVQGKEKGRNDLLFEGWQWVEHGLQVV